MHEQKSGPTLVALHTHHIKEFAEQHPDTFLMVVFTDNQFNCVLPFDEGVAALREEKGLDFAEEEMRESMEMAKAHHSSGAIVLTFAVFRGINGTDEDGCEFEYGTMSCEFQATDPLRRDPETDFPINCWGKRGQA